MPQQARNFIWRKGATQAWLAAREIELSAVTGGQHSVVERPGSPRLSVEVFCANRKAAEQLVAQFGGAIVELPIDWQAQFFAAHRTEPLRIGKRLRVVGDQRDLAGAAAGSALVIPAGAAFGTGEHATTAMSLRLLERVSRKLPPGWRMLDAGTGSGVLALAGKRFGAGEVVAIDNDPTAIVTARENARANGISGIKFAVGNITEVEGDALSSPRIRALVMREHHPPRRNGSQPLFDVIAANLYSELLASILPRFGSWLATDGRLILSGILRTQEPKLTRGLRRNGFRVLEARRRGKWVALLAAGVQKRS